MNKVESARKRLGWTRRELANKAGVTEQTIINVEGCNNDCAGWFQRRVIDGVSAALGLEPGKLFTASRRAR